MTYWTFTDASIQTLPVGTLYCIGRNYADHAAEMGAPLPATGTVADPIVFLHHHIQRGPERRARLPEAPYRLSTHWFICHPSIVLDGDPP